MANLPLNVLAQPLTKEQIQASILGLCAAAGLRTTAWQSGGVTLTLIGVFAQVLGGFSQAIAFFVQAGFLDLATGPFLTLLAYYGYGVTRIPSTYAATNLTVTNSGGGYYSYEIGDFLATTATGQTYTNQAPFVLQPVSGAPANVVSTPFIAQVAGKNGTAAPGAINAPATAIPGVSVTNPTSAVGLDAELDPALRQRCRDSLGALSPNGPKSAYLYVAKSATRPDGSNVGVTRVYVLPATGNGIVTVYVASASGPLSTSPDGGDLAIVNNAIQTQCVPDGPSADVFNATQYSVPITATVWVYAGISMTNAQVITAVSAALDAYFPTVPIGGVVLVPLGAGIIPYRQIENVITAACAPFGIEAKLSVEADITMFTNYVAVPGAYTITVNQVAGP